MGGGLIDDTWAMICTALGYVRTYTQTRTSQVGDSTKQHVLYASYIAGK